MSLLSINFANLVPIWTKSWQVKRYFVISSNVLNQVCSVVSINRYLEESRLKDIRQKAFQGTRLRSLCVYNLSVHITFIVSNLDYKYSLFCLVRRCVTRKETARKNWPREILGTRSARSSRPQDFARPFFFFFFFQGQWQ